MNLQEQISRIQSMMGVIKEGLHDTSWENEEGDKITLMDLLNATKDIPVENISVKKLKPYLLTWDNDEDEVKKIDSSDLQYPILIFVDNDGEFISIIDGHHRAQKAVRKGLETIKAKVIPINSLPKDIRKVFSHMGRQEEMKEGELTDDVKKNDRVDLSSKMEKLFESYIEKNGDILCSIKITAPWNRETVEPDKSFQHYEVSITFIGGYGTKYWPRTMAVLDIYDDISNMVWNRIYNFFNEAVDIYTKAVPTCPTIEKEEETEGVGAYAAPAFEMKPDHIHFKHEYNEGEITERCWKGYTQKGMKTMFGKRYPNCVKIKK